MTSKNASATASIVSFSKGQTNGHAGMKEVLGGKGANLAEMARLDLPVPPGFIITTAMCEQTLREGHLPSGLMEEVRHSVAQLETLSGQIFGGDNPLLLSVRSGAAVSMPGMMDTLLNLGLNDQTAEALAASTRNPAFAYDCYRRLIMMYADVVENLPRHDFEEMYQNLDNRQAESLKNLCDDFKDRIQKQTGHAFPQDPWEQLQRSIQAVFMSWNNARAREYRRLHHIEGLKGTAVNVQAMVFGNRDSRSASGVAFTRDPATGHSRLYCDLLFEAQGEDVVAGTHTPQKLDALQQKFPALHDELLRIARQLEEHFSDMQDIEFTIDSGELYILQTRTGKRTARAALKIAVDLVNEKRISKNEALLRVEPHGLQQLLHPMFDPQAARDVLASGIPTSPGAAVGEVVFDPDRAVERVAEGRSVILVREETSADDIHGMAVAQGIITFRGGRTSHAAVVARQMGKPCVAGVGSLSVNEGDELSLDGSTGEIMLGALALVPPTLDDDFKTFMKWADDVRTLGVKANADTPEDAARAREYGAEGIGLCRTEHMFFKPERIREMQKMILATSDAQRQEALQHLLPFQQKDFAEIFRAMEGLPVTIRLLDPPLHEFLPPETEDQSLLAHEMNLSLADLQDKIETLSEKNPMLGFRGCRLGIVYPDIYRMQVRAIVEAAMQVKNEGGDPRPQIMLPFISSAKEFSLLRQDVINVIDSLQQAGGETLKILVGTMIEVPRAALTADKIAREADFFSFGTNDLTQMTLGISRDDAEAEFLNHYLQLGLFPSSPFVTLDEEGVGYLVQKATQLGKKSKADLEVGLCGEQGADPKTIAFLNSLSIDYVSCSPFRLPVARLAAAQAVLNHDS